MQCVGKGRGRCVHSNEWTRRGKGFGICRLSGVSIHIDVAYNISIMSMLIPGGPAVTTRVSALVFIQQFNAFCCFYV